MVIFSLIALILYSSAVNSDSADFQADPNMKLHTAAEFSGSHTLYQHVNPLRTAGKLTITDEQSDLSIRLLGLEYYNVDGTKAYMPIMSVLSAKKTAYTFYVDALIDYGYGKNMLDVDGLPIAGKLKTRLFLLNTGEQLYLAWTIYSNTGNVLLDETYYTEKTEEKPCSFVNQRLICK